MGFHLCLVCDEYPPCNTGGVGIFSRSLARMLVEAGNKVTVVGIYQPFIRKVEQIESEDDRGVNVFRLPPSSGTFGNRIKLLHERLRLSAWIKQNETQMGFDLLEAPEYSGPLVFYNGSLPVIVRIHSSTILKDAVLKRKPTRLFHLFEKGCLKKADFVLAVSRYCAEMTMELSGIRKEYQVIYNAVDTDFFSPDASLPIEKNTILCTGTVAKQKGIPYLLDAMKAVLKRFPDARLILIGKDSFRVDGKDFQRYLSENLQAEVRERIQFRGSLPHGEEFLSSIRRANVCVFPSFVEGFGLSAVEAMSCGRPVVFSECCSGPEIIEHGKSGLLCDPHTPDDIAEKICMILGDEAFAERLGFEARKRVLSLFSMQQWIEQNIMFYSHSLKERHAI